MIKVSIKDGFVKFISSDGTLYSTFVMQVEEGENELTSADQKRFLKWFVDHMD